MLNGPIEKLNFHLQFKLDVYGSLRDGANPDKIHSSQHDEEYTCYCLKKIIISWTST
jgi:hypothetical protein